MRALYEAAVTFGGLVATVGLAIIYHTFSEWLKAEFHAHNKRKARS